MTNKIGTILAQLVFGFVAVMLVYFAGVGNGWELIAMPIACTVAALIGGRLTGDSTALGKLAIGALIGSAIGAVILLIPIAWGFAGVLLPVIGAIGGYFIVSQQTP